jgi:hypothetical protein
VGEPHVHACPKSLSPIPLSAPDVLAFLSGNRTQIRFPITARNSLVDGRPSPKLFAALVWNERVYVDPGPSPAGNPGPYLHVPHRNGDSTHRVYPRWGPGDRLWAQEAFGLSMFGEVHYRATDNRPWSGWRSSSQMTQDHSRLDLDVAEARAQRLHDITEEDARAEGVEPARGVGFPTVTRSRAGRTRSTTRDRGRQTGGSGPSR